MEKQGYRRGAGAFMALCLCVLGLCCGRAAAEEAEPGTPPEAPAVTIYTHLTEAEPITMNELYAYRAWRPAPAAMTKTTVLLLCR
ncbi:MAG: hypothetical protein K2L03_01785, partial [Bacteroidales bacterium]|nr:hypothetical protein [Bacteroidales bacterium]